MARITTVLDVLVADMTQSTELKTVHAWIAMVQGGSVGQAMTELMERLLELREIAPSNACTACHGVGKRTYSNTTTWRGGIGGQAMTTDVCDRCWGSGDKTHTWLNLRAISQGAICGPCTEFLRNELRKAIREEAK